MKLRLGALPNNELVKLTVSLPVPLKEQLDRYAELHSSTFGSRVDAPSLIPHMIAQFLARDRAFQRALKSSRSRESSS